jgi:phosphatidylglycerophosphate synthase
VNDPHGAATGRPRQWDSLTDWVRARAAAVLDPVARFLGRHGVHPNTVTLVGFLLQVGVGTLFALGRIRLGGLLLLVVGPLDALDGAVARANGQDAPFGAFLDSTLDRLSDAALILGLTAYYLQLQRGALLEVALLLLALVSALMVSYTRARAEALGLSCKVGLLTRMERVFLIAVLSALGLMTLLVWTLALLSLLTFVQRVIYVYHVSSRHD